MSAAGSALLLGIGLVALASGTASAADPYFAGPVPRANCGPGSLPEPALQGEVPLADRNSGRSQLGYRCNLALVGQHQGQGAGWQNTWYDHCDYYDTKTAEGLPQAASGNGTGNGQTSPGVQVIDVSNPTHPVLTTNLDTPAMDGPWESLKVNQKRALLAGVGGFGDDGDGPLFFDVYDVKGDCAHPKLLSSTTMDLTVGHEGNWAPDGMTYYASGANGLMTAIDVSNPASPSILMSFKAGIADHGLSLSDDGKTLYAADPAALSTSIDGLDIYDVSGIQARTPGAVPSLIGSLGWPDGSTAQHTIPIFYGTHPYLVFVDEGGGGGYGPLGQNVNGLPFSILATTGVPAGAARIIDIANPASPQIVSVARLEIQEASNAAVNQADIAGNGIFGYEAHYCAVDREYNPTAMACGYFQSGIRVFDIRDPALPKEIAYFNPPAQELKGGQLPGSEHSGNLTTDWCSSQIRFVDAPDGNHYLWAQCQDNGFMVLKFTNGAYPLSAGSSTSVQGVSTTVKVAAASSTLPNTGTAGPLPRLSLLVLPATLLALFAAARRLRRLRSGRGPS